VDSGFLINSHESVHPGEFWLTEFGLRGRHPAYRPGEKGPVVWSDFQPRASARALTTLAFRRLLTTASGVNTSAA